MEQRSNEWFQARLGKLTASRFDDIVKLDGTLRTGERPLNYMNEKIYELLNNKPFEIESNMAMQWGTDTEQEARLAYEYETFETVEEVGFVTHQGYGYIGCSSDGLVGEDGGIEIKCPYNSGNHISTLVNDKMPNRYKAQVQGNIFINELKWMDYVSYDPRMEKETMKIKIIRYERDDSYLRNLVHSLREFWHDLHQKLSNMGITEYETNE